MSSVHSEITSTSGSRDRTGKKDNHKDLQLIDDGRHEVDQRGEGDGGREGDESEQREKAEDTKKKREY
jgi:hypothetical protein